ncbi:tetratricopeptide repeat protein [Polynucleobacter necessarius]|uniref:tetratricopeptide repeat protein n=1 Tax=Polynucleobacter necessarius TaxID=576610 RepID=UPI0013B04F0E|nr:tetratricopeptide repeat protein [Polynucleobacter necessarius]
MESFSAQRGQYSEALKYLNDSLKALPKNSLALSNLGNVLHELKQYENAIDAYDKSIKIDPKYAEAWSNKGNALYELKRFDEAVAHFDKALSLWILIITKLHGIKAFLFCCRKTL